MQLPRTCTGLVVALLALGAAALPRALPDTRTELPGAEVPHRHPGLTQAILYPHTWEDEIAAQDTIQSEDDLQSDNGARHLQKRAAENATTEANSDEDYDESDMFLESQQEPKSEDTDGMSQHFFPSFAPLFPPAPPLGHSRPQLLFQEPAHSHRPPLLRPQHNAFQPIGFGAAKYLQAPVTETENTNNNLLGSGNFGVIRGGTFYTDDERRDTNEYGSGESHHVFSPFYQSNNGHGRPAFYNGASNPRPQQHRGNDFFANFRDFADINTPTKSSYSEYYVVYVNKNATDHNNTEVAGENKPKNIIEQLTLIDQEDATPKTSPVLAPSSIDMEKPMKKSVSAGKLKLAQLQLEKSNKQKSKKPNTTINTAAKDLHEPLLALS